MSEQFDFKMIGYEKMCIYYQQNKYLLDLTFDLFMYAFYRNISLMAFPEITVEISLR